MLNKCPSYTQLTQFFFGNPLYSVIIQRNSIIFETSKNQNKSKNKDVYSVKLCNKLKFQSTKSEKRSSMKLKFFKPAKCKNQFRECNWIIFT